MCYSNCVEAEYTQNNYVNCKLVGSSNTSVTTVPLDDAQECMVYGCFAVIIYFTHVPFVIDILQNNRLVGCKPALAHSVHGGNN